MQTDKIFISSDGSGMAMALEESDRFCSYAGLTGKSALHVRLLTEEALGLVRGIMGEVHAAFWLESKKKGKRHLCKICVSTKTNIDYSLRQELLSVSSTGENAAAVGIMGKIRDLIEQGLQGYEEASRYQAETGLGLGQYASMGMLETGDMTDAFYWSLDAYREQVSQQGEEAEAAWDELEKSVVAKLADEVRVGILRDRVDLVIEKLV